MSWIERKRVMGISVLGYFTPTLFALAYLLCCHVLLKIVWITALFCFVFHLWAFMNKAVDMALQSEWNWTRKCLSLSPSSWVLPVLDWGLAQPPSAWPLLPGPWWGHRAPAKMLLHCSNYLAWIDNQVRREAGKKASLLMREKSSLNFSVSIKPAVW